MVRLSIFSASNLLAWYQSFGIWFWQGAVVLGRIFLFLPVQVELLVPLYLADAFPGGRHIALAVGLAIAVGLELTCWLGFAFLALSLGSGCRLALAWLWLASLFGLTWLLRAATTFA